jgi:hypothetical protein
MDRYLICAAYCLVAGLYHSGQNSLGYRKLSQVYRIGFRCGYGLWLRDKWSPERTEAARLLWKRRREIRRCW